MEAILIPVKRFDEAKLRLAGVLGPRARRRLVLSMLGDVLEAAAAWPLRLLVTSDADAALVAERAGWSIVPDPGAGLNAAVTAGTQRAVAEEAAALLVLPFDVPLVTPGELSELFAIDADVIISRSDDGGTTGLLRRPPGAIDAMFGPASANAHAEAARRAGLRVRSLRLPGLALDVDDPADLQLLATSARPNGSVQVARELLVAPGF